MSGALESPRDIRAMFDRIAPRYDTINRIMTAGRDSAWRKKAAQLALDGLSGARVLDVGTGTGELARELADAGASCVVGVDFSTSMIELAVSRSAGRDRVHFLRGDGMRLPFAGSSFDTCTIGFGLRNMQDYDAALREICRVIRPGGRFVCLELTPIRRPLLGRLFNAYFSRMAPLIGGPIAGDKTAYHYLPRSVANFMSAEELAERIEQAGFAKVKLKRLALGTVAIHTAIRPSVDS